MSLSIGDRVSDFGDPEGENPIVVELCDEKASEKYIPQLNSTVFESNSIVSRDDSVFGVLYESQLNSYLPRWPLKSPEELQNAIKTIESLNPYYFPESRIEFIESGFLDDIVTLRVIGLVNPFDNTGGYSYEVFDGEFSKIASQNSQIDNLEYLDADIATYVGILDGLEFISDELKEDGLIIELSKNTIVSDIRFNNVPNSEYQEKLFKSIQAYIKDYSYFSVRMMDENIKNEFHEKAKNAYKSNLL